MSVRIGYTSNEVSKEAVGTVYHTVTHQNTVLRHAISDVPAIFIFVFFFYKKLNHTKPL